MNITVPSLLCDRTTAMTMRKSRVRQSPLAFPSLAGWGGDSTLSWEELRIYGLKHGQCHLFSSVTSWAQSWSHYGAASKNSEVNTASA